MGTLDGTTCPFPSWDEVEIVIMPMNARGTMEWLRVGSLVSLLMVEFPANLLEQILRNFATVLEWRWHGSFIVLDAKIPLD
ncbi:hypothetical protein Tco_0175284 [Tanacetum coccineum]